jgi:hypothetical protein
MDIEGVHLIEEERPALIFIPDISGFTKFINNTRIEYSKKLVHDLLEVILDSNLLNLKVAEIQGDAIFFYLPGVPPGINKLESQVKKTFLDFQKALKRMEHDYKPLKGAGKLSLKIIAHYGKISTTEIKGIVKLMGSDIIIAHRVLKNNIKGNEYFLMTEQYLETQNLKILETSFKWSEIKSGKKKYDYIGTINYKYVPLTPLRSLLKD